MFDRSRAQLALERVRANVGGELAQLVAEQLRDDTTRADSDFLISLDGFDRSGRPLYEVIAA